MPNNETNGDRYPRGSRPPLLSLSQAFRLCMDIYEHGGGQASFDLLSKITGNSSSSSSFVKKLNSLKTYGLVMEPAKGRLELTDLGRAIAAPRNPEDLDQAKMGAFQKLDVFSRIYERHKGKLLPADEFIKNIVEQDCAKPRKLANEWVAAFKDAAKTIGLLHDRGDGKTQIMESPTLRFPPLSQEATLQPEETIPLPAKQPEPPEQAVATTFVPFAASGHLTKIEISGSRYAVFTMPDHLTKRDAQKLKGALAGLSQIIDSMVEEEDSS